MRIKINPKSNRNNPFDIIFKSNGYNNVIKNKKSIATMPFLVDIELTNYCNLQCTFCGRASMKRKKGYMKTAMLKKIADECAKYNVPIRIIGWGEPFLHPRIIEYCKYIKSKGLMLHITNNGLTIKKNQFLSLIELGVDSITFSLQGATKSQYKIMRNNDNYDELENRIKEFVKLRKGNKSPFLQVHSSVTGESQTEINSFLNFWGNIVDSVSIKRTHLGHITAEQRKLLESKGESAALKRQDEMASESVDCLEVYQRLSPNWDGSVTCCCSDFDNFMYIGDLNKNTLFELWNESKRLKLFRDCLAHKMHSAFPMCKLCWKLFDEI